MKMSVQSFTQSVTRSVGRQILKSKKNSPHIFFVGGVAGLLGSGVLACRATLKLEDTLDELKKEIDQDKNGVDTSTSMELAVRNAGLVTTKSVLSIGRLYGPSILLGGISVAALTGAHVQLSRRNAALSSTLAIVTKAYDEYRQRVQKELGEEREKEIYYGVENKEVTVDGKKQVVKVATNGDLSPYAKFFDQFSPNWQKSSEMNRIFLECQQNWANHILQAKGYIFLNDVYDMLGIERTPAGQIVGWILNGDGDNYVDFGMYEKHNEAFMQGIERSILLDFNVDGPIFERI